MKNLLLLLLLPLNILAQQSWVHFQITFDFYGPSESSFFMVSDNGDTAIYVQPTSPYQYLDTVVPVDTGYYTISLTDNFGDGWTSNQPSSFRAGNLCQGVMVDFQLQGVPFTQLDTVIHVLPCPPPAPPVCVPTLVNINLDQYPSETSWDIKDSLGNTIVSGGPYINVPNYQPQFMVNCLPVGELTFTIYDSFGDGLAGSLWGGQDGSYYLMQCGDTIIYGDTANFGNSSSHTWYNDTCIPPPPVPGCMDDDYVEYDPLATVDDSSCVTLKVYGCIDSTMYNYDPLANTMENIDSCGYDLILHDLAGNGWVGTTLEIWQDADTLSFTMTSQSFNQMENLGLYAPAPVYARLLVTQQAQLTAPECGFTLIGPEGDTALSVQPPFIIPFKKYTGNTYCGNICEEKIFGCMDSTAFNYVNTANTALPCYYYPGCISAAYLQYHVDTANGYYTDVNVQDSCGVYATFGCTDSTAFNYDSLANVDNGGCLPVVIGCMQPVAFNYNPLANTPDTCIPVIFGCTNITAFNYDSLANTDDGSCIAIVFGCTDPQAFNYEPQANVDDGSCIAVVYGCTDPTMFNYNPLANVDNGSCIEFVYGCTDSTMFNYNPLANATNNSIPCIPFIYGCTDPSAFNYDPTANTEDFSCIPFVYGCMDSLALNYDSLANTDNGSCIEVVVGCMDSEAYNYEPTANVSDTVSCLYAANCITGPGNPYWLNDPCYAWVIDIDEYCCDNEWDTICQATYDYCDGTWSGPLPTRIQAEKKLVAVTDLLGRPTKINKNKLLLYIYSDGSVTKQLIKK